MNELCSGNAKRSGSAVKVGQAALPEANAARLFLCLTPPSPVLLAFSASTGSTCARPTSSKARSPRCSLAVEIAILWSHTNEQTGAPAFGYPAKDQRELAAECRRL